MDTPDYSFWEVIHFEGDTFREGSLYSSICVFGPSFTEPLNDKSREVAVRVLSLQIQRARVQKVL